jgi:uncharacterized protein (TIGR03083 family)
MVTDPHVARCLGSLRALSDSFASELLTLSLATWDGPTNCPPWRVRDLAAHVVSSGQGFVRFVRRGLAGSVEPDMDLDATQRRRRELEVADPPAVARAVEATTNEFIGLYQDLGEPELERICFHRRGNRSVRWYAAHRLAEIAFHSWDLRVSLGRVPTLDAEVAGLLLPTLLESNVPRTYAAGLSPERGRGERYLLAVADDPSARWLVTIGPRALETRRGDASSDLTLTASAPALALLIYGRADLTGMVRSGEVKATGDAALVERFARIFPRP